MLDLNHLISHLLHLNYLTARIIGLIYITAHTLDLNYVTAHILDQRGWPVKKIPTKNALISSILEQQCIFLAEMLLI